MTPVAERLSDERIAEIVGLFPNLFWSPAERGSTVELRIRAHSTGNGETIAKGLSLTHAKAIISALTELQHRREAEAGTPEGWVLVPREPTIAMIDAGDDPQFGNGPDIVRHIYQAMVDAAEPCLCPICAVAFKPTDMCLTDIEMGTCHAECLAGSPMVDLETGDPLPSDAPPPEPFRFAELFAASPSSPASGVRVSEEDIDRTREALSALREGHRRKMNAAADRAEMAASIGEMGEVSVNSTESERHREAFVALNVAIGIFDEMGLSALGEHP